MRKEEKEYFAALENLIRSEKKNSVFFREGSDSFALDIELLMRHLLQNDPHFTDHMFDHYVDTSQLKGFNTVAEVRELVAKMDKGSVVKWKDREGRELFYVNQGKNILTGKKQIYVCTNLLSKKDVKSLQKSFMEHILKKDLKNVYKKIQKEQLKDRSRKPSFIKEAVTRRKDYREKELENIGTGFERQFKKIVKELGSPNVDPKTVAVSMFRTMSKGEQRDISAAFSHMTTEGFNSMLTKWRDETVGIKVTQSISKSKDDGIGR